MGGIPPNHPKLDHFSIETYGFGVHPFQETSTWNVIFPRPVGFFYLAIVTTSGWCTETLDLKFGFLRKMGYPGISGYTIGFFHTSNPLLYCPTE